MKFKKKMIMCLASLSIVGMFGGVMTSCDNGGNVVPPDPTPTPVVEKYDVTITNSIGGTITSDVSKAAENEEVTLTVTPLSGSAVIGIIVNGNKVYEADLTKNSGSYTYKVKMTKSGIKVEGMYLNTSTQITYEVETYDEGDMKIIQGETLTLPKVTCKDGHGNDLSKYIKIVDETDPTAVSGNIASSDVIGEHTVAYNFVFPVNGVDTIVNSKKIKYNVYRKVFSNKGSSCVYNETSYYTSFDVKEELVSKEEQVVDIYNTGYCNSIFNIDPSKNYYAEITVNNPQDKYMGLGFSNNDPDNSATYYIDCLEGHDMNFKVKDFNTQGEGSWSLDDGTLNTLQFQIGVYNNVEIEKHATTFKMAILRNEDVFYHFVNDDLVCVTRETKYADIETAPGIFGTLCGNAPESITISNVDYYSGEDKVATKLNSLLGSGEQFIAPYTANGMNWAQNSLTNFSKVTKDSNYEEKGINYTLTSADTNWNDGMVWNKVHFEGEFTFEFDYKPTAMGTDTNNEKRIWLEVRPTNPGANDEEICFGTKFGGKEVVGDIANANIEQWFESGRANGDWDNGGVVDFSKGFHYILSRTLNEDKSEATYTATVSSINTPTQTMTRVKTNTVATGKVYVFWHNYFMSGEYTHINWTMD